MDPHAFYDATLVMPIYFKFRRSASDMDSMIHTAKKSTRLYTAMTTQNLRETVSTTYIQLTGNW